MISTKSGLHTFLAVALSALATVSLACSGTMAASSTERVRFKSGTTSATIKGAVTGYDTKNYLLGASAGQAISVLFDGNLNACYFNLIEPGADTAFHAGELAGNEYSGTLRKSGDYRAEIYMMRSVARQGKTCHFTITFEISGKGADNSLPNDAKVPGTDFHATGVIPCARNAGQQTVPCKFGVTRAGGGSGTVTVFWPDGGNRVIFFENGKPSSYDESEADGGAKMTATQNAGLNMIYIGDQRFEIPESVIYGG